MEAIVERCAGLDVHQATVVACLNIGAAAARPRKEIRSFGTMLPDLEELRDWLKANGCTLVAMGEHRHLLEAGACRAGKITSSWWWATPSTSRMCPAARPT